MINRKRLIKASELPQWLEYIQDWLPEGAMKVDGFDDCICGIVERYGMDSVLLYDTDTMIEKMITNNGMDYEDAVEYFDFNVLGSYVGEYTPCYLSIPETKSPRD